MMTFVMSNKWNGSSSLQEQLLMFRPVCVCVSVPLIVLLRENVYVWVSLNAGTARWSSASDM